VYNYGYNWDDALVELYRAGIAPVFRIRDSEFDSIIPSENVYEEEVTRLCSSLPAMREFDQILGIRVSEFMVERLSAIVGESVQESVLAYPVARRMIRE